MSSKMNAEDKTAIGKAIDEVDELDAAGWAIVILRCDRESDIRRVVEGYCHARGPQYVSADGASGATGLNMSEATACGTCKPYWKSFSYAANGMSQDPAAMGKRGTLLHWLQEGLRETSDGRDYRLLYVPEAKDVIDAGGGEASQGGRNVPLKRQCLYLMRALAERKRRGLNHSLILIGCTDGSLPTTLQDQAYVVDIECPGREELSEILTEACRECGGESNGLTPLIVSRMVEVMRGMRRDDIWDVVSLAYAKKQFPLANDAEVLYQVALDAKRQQVEGVLGLRWEDPITDPVGGLKNLKDWLIRRGDSFNFSRAAEICQVDPPKGVLVAGLPGCGKTYIAKCASQLLSNGRSCAVPLLQMDLSSMLSKWFGEAELNFRKAIRMVDNVAPCVLLIDEIEKLFDRDNGGDNQAGKRIFAALLDWLQRKKEKPVLVIATANRIELLPPELKRKGRFDETFQTGIPTGLECKEILLIQLRKKMEMFDDELQAELDGLWKIIAEGGKLEWHSQYEKDDLELLIRHAAEIQRFLTGADIEVLVNAALGKLFAMFDAKAKSEIEEHGVPPSRYSSKQVFEALTKELETTRSFFDTNMDDVVSYWLAMNKLRFIFAGEILLQDFNGRCFDEHTGRFGCPDCSDEGYKAFLWGWKNAWSHYEDIYDRELKSTLAWEIFRYVQDEKGKRR